MHIINTDKRLVSKTLTRINLDEYRIKILLFEIWLNFEFTNS
jgi:hypothetical protein